MSAIEHRMMGLNSHSVDSKAAEERWMSKLVDKQGAMRKFRWFLLIFLSVAWVIVYFAWDISPGRNGIP